MEKILVSMDGGRGAWEAWSRAISLAKRIDAKIYVLLVTPPSGADPLEGDPAAERRVHMQAAGTRERLELLIEAAKSDNIRVDYFISEGRYEEEVIRFIDQNRITLLVVESPGGDSRYLDRQSAFIRRLRHRSTCRVEVVSLRKQPILQSTRGKSK